MTNVFEWYLRGDGTNGPMSMGAIAKKLTVLGIPTRGDKSGHVFKKYEVACWAPEMIRNILKNETYTGTWHYGKTKMIDDGKVRKPKRKCGFGKQVARPKDEWVSVPVPAIISKVAYDQAQNRMELNAQQSDRNRKYEYLLSKRLRCAKCGKTYQGREKNKQYLLLL